MATGHRLEELFDGLPQEDREELERRYNAVKDAGPPEVLQGALPGRGLSLAGILEESNDAFARLRYSFEVVENPAAAPLPDAFGLWWFVDVLKPFIEEQDAPQ